MGGSGGLHTQRISATNGFRTYGSMIASASSSAGGGSALRVAKWYKQQGHYSDTQVFSLFGVSRYGQNANQYTKAYNYQLYAAEGGN